MIAGIGSRDRTFGHPGTGVFDAPGCQVPLTPALETRSRKKPAVQHSRAGSMTLAGVALRIPDLRETLSQR